MEQNATTNVNCDVLIVGAGMSGLFAAWRILTSQGNTAKVVVVDRLDRTGGRLETTTVQIEGIDGKLYPVKDEEGGMRFVPESSGGMQNLWKLINTFNGFYPGVFSPVPFPMGDGNNRYCFRGYSFTADEASANNYALWSKLFNLASNEQGKSPGAILAGVMQSILDQNNSGKQAGTWPDSPESWIQFRTQFTFEDSSGTPVPINQWGFWSLLRTYGLSSECIEWLSHVVGFMGPFESFINAGESLQIIFDFPNPTAAEFCTLPYGYQSLPDKMAEQIQTLGGEIYLSEMITMVQPQNEGFTVTGTQNNYTASKLILAIPKKAMKQLTAASPCLNANKYFVEAISDVQSMELTKVGLYFNERWWHSNTHVNLSSGPSFSDLPAGSVYCFAQFPSDPDKDKAYDGPAALTLYTDFTRGNFWEELQNIGPAYHTEEFPSNPNASVAASVNLVNELMKQIKMIFGLAPDDPTVPMPVLSTYRVWGEDPFGYGYHQNKINVNDIDMYLKIITPYKNIFVCNEAWSPEQGWVEGSLIMSDLLMQLAFKLQPFVTATQFSGDLLQKLDKTEQPAETLTA